MNWYLIHTKPRQEQCALLNLERQGYECYLPAIFTEKLRQGQVTLSEEPLFPRYLFIRLGLGADAKSWSPIRSTRGVNRLVCFGTDPAQIDYRLVDVLRAQENARRTQPQRLFVQGERVVLTDGAFNGIEAVYQMTNGESRVLVLIEFLSKPVRLSVSPSSLRKAE